MMVGTRVAVFEWGTAPDRRLIGFGIIREIMQSWRGFEGAVACVQVDGEQGRYLREIGELGSLTNRTDHAA